MDHPDLVAAWERIGRRFEQAGLVPAGRVRVVATTRETRHALGALLGRVVTRDAVMVDLAVLDQRLRERSGVGGLEAVLTMVRGEAPRNRPGDRAARADARERPLELATALLDVPAGTPWVAGWIAWLRRVGLLTGRPDAEQLVREAVAVLLELLDDAGREVESGPRPRGTRSRVEIAARVVGDAHALDVDRVLHRMVLQGLALATGSPPPEGASEREAVWARVGVAPDLLSRSALVWRLRLSGGGAVARRLDIAAEAGDPMHLTDWDLRRAGELSPMTGQRVLVCENPRVVEALAEAEVDGWAAVCTSGQSNLVVDSLLTALADSGAHLRYHGDFDWPGIAIANRVVARFGAQPWRMEVADYVDGVRGEAPLLGGAPVEPSWSAELGAAMRSHGRVLHEEAVLAELLEQLRE
ncbi:TIGR02679 family protein [Janibacter cremeus]|uniref:TIGR02679 family protein n=1 Tax=Janibacter cremeus TaxID=1285192 RepID=UPI0023FA47D2|nr:TIGR02679 family protein [Janibacter cremeus]WEV78753.1 TIGR02679 family protein [Janibacter cremeus]